MIVRCIVNDLNLIEKTALFKKLQKFINIDGPDYDLDIGKKYSVQAIENRDGLLWYYIHSVEINNYPFPYPSEFFEVINNTLSVDWCIKLQNYEEQNCIKIISFFEWVNDEYFYEKLIEDDPICKKNYLKHLKANN